MPNTLPNLQGVSLINIKDQPVAMAICLLDTTAGIGEDANTSYTANFCPMFQVNSVPVGTIVAVQAKVHKDAEWHEIWRNTDTKGFLNTYQMPYNFQRAVRLSGTGEVKAFSAMFPTDNMG